MAAYKLMDFSDIYTAILEELKVQSTDTTSLNRIKRMINMTYIDEVIPAARWNWLYGHTTLKHPLYYGSGTVSVTPNSTTVTLSTAPSTSVGESGSFLYYKFSVDGTNEIYDISAHTAESTTVTLSRAYNGTLDADANYKIWKEDLELPTDCRETIEIWHDHQVVPMEGRGLQKFREMVAEHPKAENRPFYYTMYDFRDPSTGDSETESDRYRLLKVYPSISQYSTILKVDYIKEASALENSGDEPLMPIEDRIVLFYGALSLAWGSIGRNPEEAMRNRQLFEAKLARMMGKITDSFDKPRIEPESTYIIAKRGPRISGLSRRSLGAAAGGQSTYTAPSYLENVTINGATITGNVTVSSSITIDGRDLSVDGAAADAHIAASTNVHGLSGGAAVVGTSQSQTLTNKTIDADSNTITNIENADIKAAAAIERTKLANGTAYRIVANNATGVLSENAALTASRIVTSDSNGQLASSAITSTEVTYLDDVEALTSATLADNTASATNVATWAHASFQFLVIDYSLSRGAGNRECGTLHIATDGTTASIAQSAASIGTLGTTFTVDISGTDLRLRYTTTSTGTAATMKYKLQKWV